jgi:plastocyanin
MQGGIGVLKQRGIVAALVAVAGTAAVGVAGSAGAAREAADFTVYAVESGGVNCFSTTPGTCSGPVELDISAAGSGDTVIFAFPGPYNEGHNASSRTPSWSFSTGGPSNPHTPNPDRATFTQNGTYEFVCDAHAVAMKGTIRVTGGADPTSSATSTATASPTPSTQPSDPGTNTPPPTGGTADAVKPTLRSIGATGKRRSVKVSFRLSENATVTIRVKRGSRVVKAVTKQLAAGKRSVRVRSSKLRKGRYKIEVRARDASGNVSTLASKSLRIRT